MKVLLAVRRDYRRRPGGDMVQLGRYQSALAELGHDAEICTSAEAIGPSVDAVHLFNLDRPSESIAFARQARKVGCKVAFSTIHHPSAWISNYLRNAQGGWQAWGERTIGLDALETTKELIRCGLGLGRLPGALLQAVVSRKQLQRELISLTDLILLLSPLEGEEIAHNCGCPTGRTQVLRNGGEIDPAESAEGISADVRALAESGRPFAVCLGRIEPRKNQLRLMEAARDLLQVVFVGGENRLNKAYAQRFHEQVDASGDRVFYTGPLGRGAVRWLLNRAAMHASPSWVEVSPLTDLEALFCGAAAVTTTRSYSIEYGRGLMTHCEPESIPSIQGAITQALQRGRSTASLAALKERGLTWDHCGRNLVQAYESMHRQTP